MAVLTLNSRVPVKEDFLVKNDESAVTGPRSREDAVNGAIDDYLRRKKETDEFFAFCDGWVKENDYTKEEFLEDLKEYYAEVYGAEDKRLRW